MNNVLVITYWSLPDALIQTYTLPYVRILREQLPDGSKIWLLTLERESSVMEDKKNDFHKRLLEEGICWLPFGYKPFGAWAFILWLRVILRMLTLILTRKISTIHCWATPAGAMGYLLSLMTGRKLIIDSYEPHAEAMVENGTWRKSSLAFRLLFWLERKQTSRAYAVIAATEGMRSYAKEKYGMVPERFWVKPACVDLHLFASDKIKNPALLNELKLTRKIVCVYAGKLGGIYLGKETFEFFKVAHDFWGDRFRVLILSSHTKEEIADFCLQSSLNLSVVQLLFVPHAKVPDYMGLGDFAITPVKPVPTKRYCTPIKDGEYWALGLPVVIPAGISDDSELVEEYNAGAILQSLNPEQYSAAVRKVDILLRENHESLFTRIHGLAVRYRSFQIAERVYESIYKGL